MKNILYILVFTLLTACNSSVKMNMSASDQINGIKSDSDNIPENEVDLNGTWGLTNYFDTIIDKKELAKYRIQTPTWFAILLEIKNDSIRNYGSIENNRYKLKKSHDTLITFTSNVSGDSWYLILKEPYLNLVQAPNSKRIDSTVYLYKKRDDFNTFTKKNRDFFIIGNNVTEFFNNQLFKGKYINELTQKEVIFGGNGALKGIDEFDTYEVGNYFGTLHMHKNLDVITFKNKGNNEYKQYNWVIKENQLLLTEFVDEKVTYNGKTYDGDNLILGKEIIKLIKQ